MPLNAVASARVSAVSYFRVRLLNFKGGDLV